MKLRLKLNLIATVVSLTVLATIGLLHVSKSRSNSSDRLLASNILRIQYAIDNYSDLYTEYPNDFRGLNDFRSWPPATSRPTEKDLLSWRVLILPHIGTKGLEQYSSFALNESWQSSKNQDVAKIVPLLFRPLPTEVEASSECAVFGIVTRYGEWDNGRYIVGIRNTTAKWHQPLDISNVEFANLVHDGSAGNFTTFSPTTWGASRFRLYYRFDSRTEREVIQALVLSYEEWAHTSRDLRQKAHEFAWNGLLWEGGLLSGDDD